MSKHDTVVFWLREVFGLMLFDYEILLCYYVYSLISFQTKSSLLFFFFWIRIFNLKPLFITKLYIKKSFMFSVLQIQSLNQRQCSVVNLQFKLTLSFFRFKHNLNVCLSQILQHWKGVRKKVAESKMATQVWVMEVEFTMGSSMCLQTTEKFRLLFQKKCTEKFSPPCLSTVTAARRVK